MGRILRLLLAAGVLAGLWVLVRELLEGADDRSREAGGVSTGLETSSAAAGRSNGAGELSKAELYRQAQRLDVQGRSKMSKEELARAVAEARGRSRS
jgi:hypothetical protein